MSKRALLVYKKSTFQLYVLDRSSTRVEKLLAQKDPSVTALERSHQIHGAAIKTCTAVLKQAGYQVKRTYRARLGTLQGYDLIVTVGGDGTLLDVSHYLRSDIPVLGVNSDPERSVGMLAGATVDSLGQVLRRIADGELPVTRVGRLELRLDGRLLPELALNDVLIANRNPAATSRYRLEIGEFEEPHTGSGLWISTAVGSTAAIRSAGGEVQAFEDERMQFRAREPFDLRDTMQLCSGYLDADQRLSLHSKMREGHIYVDGPHVRYLFGLGARVTLRLLPASLGIYFSDQARQRRRALLQ